jgi:hypothetical protein
MSVIVAPDNEMNQDDFGSSSLTTEQFGAVGVFQACRECKFHATEPFHYET